MLNTVSVYGPVRTPVDRTTSDTYPVNIPALTNYTVYIYASYVDAVNDYQYLLGGSSASGANIGIPASHKTILGHWGFLVGGSSTILDSTEALPRNRFTALVVTRVGSTVRLYRDGVLKNTVTDSTACPAITKFVLNGFDQASSYGCANGTQYVVAGIDDFAWSDGEVRSFADNPFSVYKAPASRLWAVSSVITLVGANSSEANTSGTGAISQVHILAGATSTQSDAASAAAITQTHILVGANSSQDNVSSTGSIAGGANLTAASSDQANASSTGAITQTHALVITALAQVNPSSAIAITQIGILRGTNLAQSNSGGAGAISLSTGNLAVASPVQINLTGAGAISQSGTVFDQGPSSPAVSTAFKKPGIPAGTPPWLKIFLEIIAGRRGNKIAVPLRQNLTFSATPTKAECEALYSYVNDVRASLDTLVNRLDS